MIITGINGSFNIPISDLHYFYVDGYKLRLITTEARPVNVDYSTNYQALFSAREVFKLNYRQIITVSDWTSGRSYYLNVAKITGATSSGAVITVTLSNSETILINCYSESKAIFDLDYINKVRTHYDFLNVFAGTRITVDDSGGAQHTTITGALAVATTGQAIIIEPGSYTENIVLKDGVKLYFKDGAILNGKFGRTVNSPNSPYTSAILGQGTFRQSDAGEYIYHAGGDDNLPSPTSNLYVEFKLVETNGNRSFFFPWNHTKVIIKGGECKSLSAPYISFADTDCGITVDIDVCEISGCQEITYIAFNGEIQPGIENNEARCCLRNIHAVNDDNSPLVNATSNFFSLEPHYYYDLECTFLENNYNLSEPVGGIYTDGDNSSVKTLSLALINNIFKTISTYALYSWTPGTYKVRGSNYSTRGYNTNKITLDEPGKYLIDAGLTGLQSVNSSDNINVFLMPLTNKPVKSKYQVGQAVAIREGLQIIPAVVKSVRTAVNNPLNDANGIQSNFYKFTETGDREYPESVIYVSRNFALMMINGGTRLNLFSVSGATGLVLGASPDLTAMNFTGYNFTGADFSGALTDGANFTGATLPVAVNTKSAFRSAVKSYDPQLTLWTDGNPILSS